MKPKYILIAILLVLLLIVPVFLYYGFLAGTPVKGEPSSLFVGVDVAFDNVAEIKMLVDEISPYTNTIVIGSTGITHDMAKLDDICQYVYDRSFYLMIYAHPINNPDALVIQREWVLDAKPRWGDHFLGLYAFDEPGGRQLENASYKVVHDDEWFADNYDNYTEAADKYGNTALLKLHHLIED